LESEEDLSGQTVQCPSCNKNFTAPRATSQPVAHTQTTVNLSALRDPKEGTAFGWLVFFSIILWILLALWIVSSFGLVLIIIGFIALVRYMIELFAVAYIKTNAVEVSDRQFPEIHRLSQDEGTKLRETRPTWARLLVACSFVGLAGPSERAWTWSPRLFLCMLTGVPSLKVSNKKGGLT